MQSKRQLQIAEIIKRNFGQVLLQEGSYIYDDAFVTVTSVIVSPDQSQAKIYLSVYNVASKGSVILLLEQHNRQLKQALAHRIKKHVRRIPDIYFFLDETLDEAFKLESLFEQLHREKQMGEEE